MFESMTLKSLLKKPFLKWLQFTPPNKHVNLSAIYIAESAGQGLLGDRYYNKCGYWDPVEGCQLTLISAHDLQLARRSNSINFANGSHRRNLVIEGIKTRTLEGRQFRIGEAIFSYEKPRPPCGYLNKIEGKGMAKALSFNSGICIRVKQSGQIKVGDVLEILS